MTPDEAEIETNGKPAQGEPEHIHLGIGGPGDEKKADKAEHGHHQPDDKITDIVFHLHLSCAAEAKWRPGWGLTLIHINAPRRSVGHQPAMLDSLHWLGTLCGADAVFQGGLLLGLFVAGAAGSVVHCGPMCGAFVLGQVSERMGRLPAERLCEWQRIGTGLLLPYHLGRLTTYAGLGALGACSVSFFGHQVWFGSLSGVLLLIAALLFLTRALVLTKALKRIVPSAVGNIDRAPRVWSQMIGRITRLIVRGSAPGEYLLGLALGFLPCGFLYAAIAAAAASGRPVIGAAAMISFGLGTIPVLMVLGVAGQTAARRWNRGITVAAPIVMALNAALLLALAWQRLA
jgi:uncharacterized protein